MRALAHQLIENSFYEVVNQLYFPHKKDCSRKLSEQNGPVHAGGTDIITEIKLAASSRGDEKRGET